MLISNSFEFFSRPPNPGSVSGGPYVFNFLLLVSPLLGLQGEMSV